MMRRSFGETRSSIGGRHAFLSPDSHEIVTQPDWPGCEVIVLISPQMGADFLEYFVDVPEGNSVEVQKPIVETFLFVLAGKITISINGNEHELSAESYAYAPPGCWFSIESSISSRLVVLEKKYIDLGGRQPPLPFVNHVSQLPLSCLKGDERLPLQKLIPEDLVFDFEVNVMGFEPGASLPYVETHFMEHGLVFLNGGGVYRLEDSWYTVATGDVIWMGPFCPQWFGALGRENARYLIYKNWNRSPFAK